MHSAEDIPYRLGQVETKVAKHQKDLYEGNGKKALTERTSLLEADMVDVRLYITESKDNQKWIIRLIIGVLVVGLLNLILRK